MTVLGKTPHQAIYDSIFELCRGISENTFDYLPDADAVYPFIHLGDSQSQNAENVDMYGECEQVINIWGLRKDRGAIDKLSMEISDGLSLLRQAYGYMVKVESIKHTLMVDTSTSKLLLHNVMEVSMRYNRKG